MVQNATPAATTVGERSPFCSRRAARSSWRRRPNAVRPVSKARIAQKAPLATLKTLGVNSGLPSERKRL